MGIVGEVMKITTVDGNISILGKLFRASSAFVMPMRYVKNPCLLEIQKMFDLADLAHTSAEHAMLYLLENDGDFQLLWVCGHFEDALLINMAQLCGIMANMTFLETPDGDDAIVEIELLDLFAEKLVISIGGVSGGILF